MTNLFDSLKVLTIHQMMEESLFIGWATKPTPGEMQAMEGFLIEHAHLKKDVEIAQTILLVAKKDSLAVPTEQEKEPDLTLLMQRLSAPAVSAQNTKALENRRPSSKKATVRYLWSRLAVAASSLLLIAYIFMLLAPGEQEMYATGPGEILDFSLPDGTEVFLNANSVLTIPEGGWKDGARTVTLEGEAYFSVTKQADKRAFIVRTTDTDVRVLGTRFNVRERRGSTRIFLEEGSVRVGWKDARSKVASYRASIGYLGRQSILIGVGHRRLTASINARRDFFDNQLTLTADAKLASIQDRYVNERVVF
jgi:transmembrane sensor